MWVKSVDQQAENISKVIQYIRFDQWLLLLLFFRFTALSSTLPKGIPRWVHSCQHVLSCPIVCHCVCSCSVEPRVERSVHHLLLCCTCLYQWVPAQGPSGHAGTHPSGPHHPWEAPALQGVLLQWRSLASYLCHMVPEQWRLGNLCGWGQEGHGLRHRYFQRYIWRWDIHSGSGPRFIWREFHRAIFWKYHRPECLEYYSGKKACPRYQCMFTHDQGHAFQLEPWPSKQSSSGQRGAGLFVLPR